MEKNLLDKLNAKIQDDILQKKTLVLRRREADGYVFSFDYFVNQLKERIISANNDISGIEGVDISFVDREMFGADVAIKIPKLLKEKGSALYIKEIVPQIVANLKKIVDKDADFVEVEHKGIYINILLSNKYLFENIWQVMKMGDLFGRSDIFKKKSVVVDYSSPNVAKHLHAGHIRSTIIGEVLCNIYEAVGYTVHRLNYINDWGGMGFMIEGYERWIDKISQLGNFAEMSKNDVLYFVYQIFRRGEKVSADENEFNALTPTASDELAQYYGDFSSFLEFKGKFEEFKNSADQRFKNLEKGMELEFSLWRKMREWSLLEFDEFYKMIGIEHDYLLGESFYAKRALDLVEDRLRTGEAVLFTESLAEEEIEHLKNQLEIGELTKERFDQLVNETKDDIGACFVILGKHRRLLVKKSNGATLYAVRDLAGIEHRVETFNPARLVYETAEEQTEYFKNLFESAGILNLDQNHNIQMTHVAHGFYVDSATGKKLSSREGVDSVTKLIQESINYFRKRYDERSDDKHQLTDEEKDLNARKLAIGSITFNDIKQDKRFPIALDNDTSKSIKVFEESGGAYVMYSLARAGSIIRKSDISPEDVVVGLEDFKDMTEDEIGLIKKIGEFPNIIGRSAIEDNPATLAGYLLNLANDYNGYYEKSKVLEGGKLIYPHRLLITSAVSRVLSNGLRICHAEAPEII